MLGRNILMDGQGTVTMHAGPEDGAIRKPKRTMATAPRLSLFFSYKMVCAMGTNKQVRV